MASDKNASELIEARPEDLDTIVERSQSAPVLLYFTASWCMPCVPYSPRVHAYAARHPQLDAYVVDGDECPTILDRFAITSFPTTVLVRAGSVVWRHAGALETAELDEVLDSTIPIAAEDTTAAAVREREQARALHSNTLDAADGAPRSVVVPELQSEFVSVLLRRPVANFGESPFSEVAPGETIELSEGTLVDIAVHTDERSTQDADLGWFEHAPSLPFEHVSLSASGLSAAALLPLRGHRIQEIDLVSPEPIAEETLDELFRVGAASYRISAPGFDAALRASLSPGTIVNQEVRLPGTATAIPPLDVSWTEPAAVRSRLAAKESFTLYAQAAHAAERQLDEARERELLAANRDAALVVTSVYRDDELSRQLLLTAGDAPILAIVHDGVVVERRPFDAAGLIQEFLGDEGRQRASADGQQLPIRSVRGARSVAAGERPAYLSLIAPGARPAGVLEVREDTEIPAGWRSRLEVQAFDAESGDVSAYRGLPIDEVQLELYDDAASSLQGIDGIAHADTLTLIGDVTEDEAVAIIDSFPALLAVNLPGTAADARSRIVALHPGLVVNGRWPNRVTTAP